MTVAHTPGPEQAAEHETAEELYEHAPCGYLSTALDGTILRANRTFLGWTGHSAADLVGRRRFQDLLAPGTRLFYETHHLAQLERTDELSGVDLDVLGHDGEVLPILVSSVIVRPAHGNPVIRSTLFDATERRAYEQSLREARNQAEAAEERLRALQRIGAACTASWRLETLGEAVVQAVAGTEAVAGATLWLVDLPSGELRALAPTGSPDDPAPAPLAANGATAEAEAWRHGRIVVVDAGPQAVLHLPLPGEDGAVGVLTVHLAPHHPLGDDDRVLWRTAATQVGQAIDRALLHRALEHRAHHDELTGLPNRSLLRDRFDQAVARAARTGADTTVVVVDLDGFKAVNDRAGHAAGDRVLVEVGRRLAASVRPGDTVARLGGDEFAVLCENADEATAVTLVRRLGRALELVVHHGDLALPVSVSVGHAVLRGDAAGPTLDDLLAVADRAMYDRKRDRSPT